MPEPASRAPAPGSLSVERGHLPPGLAGLPASIPEALAARATIPDAPWVIGNGFRLSFGEADARSAVLAGRLLAAGVGKGTRLGLLFPNTPDWVVSWLAAARIGALTVPLSTFSPGRELARGIRHVDVAAVLSAATFAGQDLTRRWEEGLPGLAASGPRLQLADTPFLRWISVAGDRAPAWSSTLPEPLDPGVVAAAQQEVGPADALVVVSTSGATAAPKAVVHTHGSLIRHAAEIAGLRGLTGADRIYSPMPFFWVGGLTTVLLYSLTSGAAAVVQERFEPAEALELMERERVTFVSCWPNAARTLADHPTFAERDLTSVRGGTLIEALPEALRPASVDLNPIQLGMTETGGPHSNPDDTYSPLPEHLRGTFGRVLSGIEYAVVDATGMVLPPGETGELLVRGPFLMEQLYKTERHQAFTRDGWYATGDLCSIDSGGYLRYAGRMTTMIKTAGSNVASAEVEAALREADGVRDAYVFGLPAGPRGEDVAAVVVPSTAADLRTADLTAHARQLLSSFKVPRHWLILADADVPMTATGKTDIQALRARFAGHLKMRLPMTASGISGQRVLVVGASSGIGRGLAGELAARGAIVAAAARRAERLKELPDVVPLQCDITLPGAVDAMVEAAVERLGGLDALVYAAGLSRLNPLHEASFDDWVELFAPNVFGAAIVTRAALPHLLADGSQGRALYLTSDSAAKPYPGMVLYSSAKAALAAYALGLASEFPALKVTDVMVGPTAGTEVANHFDPELFGVWAAKWFDEGYIRYEMLQVADVVSIIVDALATDAPPALVRATGAPATSTIDAAREAAGSDQPVLGSAIASARP